MLYIYIFKIIIHKILQVGMISALSTLYHSVIYLVVKFKIQISMNYITMYFIVI